MSSYTAPHGWLNAITTAPSRAIATRTGLAASTITRAANADNPPPAVVVAVARAYDYDPVHALVMCGFLEPEEAKGHGVDSALAAAPSAALLHELLRREQDRPTD
ncbi:hypothetical protein [Corynebacterium urogenitale]